MSRLRTVLSILVWIGYPLALHLCIHVFGIRAAACVMAFVLVVNTAVDRYSAKKSNNIVGTSSLSSGSWRWLSLLVAGLMLLGAALNQSSLVLLWPTVLNGALFVVFASTLRRGPPMVERFARRIHPDLSTAEQRWCALWTKLWAAFFVLNGTSATILAFFAPLTWWTLYTSLIAYVAMGAMFAVEWTLRTLKFGRRFRTSSSEVT